jgi:hypothetical protein
MSVADTLKEEGMIQDWSDHNRSTIPGDLHISRSGLEIDKNFGRSGDGKILVIPDAMDLSDREQSRADGTDSTHVSDLRNLIDNGTVLPAAVGYFDYLREVFVPYGGLHRSLAYAALGRPIPFIAVKEPQPGDDAAETYQVLSNNEHPCVKHAVWDDAVLGLKSKESKRHFAGLDREQKEEKAKEWLKKVGYHGNAHNKILERWDKDLVTKRVNHNDKDKKALGALVWDENWKKEQKDKTKKFCSFTTPTNIFKNLGQRMLDGRETSLIIENSTRTEIDKLTEQRQEIVDDLTTWMKHAGARAPVKTFYFVKRFETESWNGPLWEIVWDDAKKEYRSAKGGDLLPK